MPSIGSGLSRVAVGLIAALAYSPAAGDQTGCAAVLSAAISELSTDARLPTSAGVALDLADLYRASGDSVKARDLYSRAATLVPDDAAARFWLGSMLLSLGEEHLSAAVDALDAACRLMPGDFYYQVVSAEARARAAARSPAATEGAHVALATARLEQGFIAEAKQTADKRVTTKVVADRLLWLKLKMRADAASRADTDWTKSTEMFEQGNYVVAMDAAELALKGFERASLALRVKDCVMRRAYCLEMLGPARRAEALAAYEKALELTRAGGFRESEGYLQWRRGVLLYHEGKVDEARKVFEAALALASATRSGEGGAAQMWLGVLDCERGLADSAERRFRSAIRAAELRCRPDDLASARHARAECLRSRGRFAEAVAELRAACNVDRERGAVHRSVLDSRLQLAELLLHAGDPASLAEASSTLGTVLADSAGSDVLHRAGALLLQGWHAWKAGHDLEAFEARVDEAAGLAGGPDVQLPRLLNRARLQLGLAFELRGDTDRAVRQLERVAAAPEAEIGRREKLSACLEHARCLVRRGGEGDLEAAEKALCDAFRALEGTSECAFGDGDDLGPIVARRDGLERPRLDFAQARAELAYSRGHIGAAIHLTATTTRVFEELPASVPRAPVLAKLAVYLLDGGRADEAERVASAALDRATAEGVTDTFGYLAARGYSRARLGKTTEAMQDLDEAAFQLRQYLLAVSPSSTGGLDGTNSYQELYDTLISLLLAGKDPKRAWALLQEKSFQLIRQGELYRAAGTGDPEVDAYAAEYGQLLDRWQTLEQALAVMPRDDPSRPAKMAEAHAARERAFEHLSRTDGAQGLRNAVVTPDTLDHVQSLLPGDSKTGKTRIVQYAFLSRAPEPALVAFVIGPGRDDVESLTLTAPGGASPEETVGKLCAKLAGRFASAGNDEQWKETARELSRLALEPVLARLAGLGVSRLIVAPDGPLHSVPFEALTTGDGLLIDSMEVSYLNAAVAVRLDREPASPRRARFVAAGNPDGTLAGAEEEVKKLAEVFPADRRDVRVRSEASLGWLTKAIETCGREGAVLHLATHGLLGDDPWESNLVLADRPLTLRHVATGLRGLLRNWLVVLSACESGKGRPASGGALLSLARAFAQAGAGTLVASLWKVDDKSTGELMAAFYREMAAGKAPGSALAAAKRELKGRYPDPYHWAPFVLLGRSW